MLIEIIKGLSVPFIGTTLGAFCVFFLKNELGKGMQKALTGFAAGVMIAASIWSLLLPAIEQGASLGVWRFIPAAIGFWIGILFLMAIDYFAPPECIEGEQKDNAVGGDPPQYSGGNGCWSDLCGIIESCRSYYSNGSVFSCIRNCDSEFPGRGDYFNAALYKRNVKKKSIHIWSPFRGSRTGGIRIYCMGSQSGCSGSSVFFKLCSGSDDLCRCGGACSENVGWRNNKYRHFYVCGRV